MKATEIRNKMFTVSKLLYEISNDLAETNGTIEWDGIDTVYLNSKLKGEILNIVKHIEGQLKFAKIKK